ncbi:MAG: PAS domain-containing sensor histidine kinase [Prevotella sp.]|nr:PAS domain-containing sensor histidine kinase [Prevotella sp.]
MIRFLSIAQLSSGGDILLLLAMGVVFFVFVWLIYFQRKQGKELKFELEQLDRLKENDIESEFVLKAMKLSTWHIDAKTMTVTYDNDFREKTDGWIPTADGEQLDESNKQLHPQDVPRVAKALEDICQGRTTDYREQYRVMLPQTRGYYWEESYATVAERDVEGKPTKIVGTSMRIDDRKNMEQALIEARNRAEESDRMKSAFIANMSHEIRTPLNAIIGFTSVLPDIDSAEERKGLLDLINENTQKLLRIIDDVVNISKIESGQEQLVLTSFDINLVLMQNAESARRDLKPGVEMDTKLARESLMITTDYNRFSMILKHLLSNATKFTSQGSIVLGYDEPVDGRIHVWVRDTGKGIAEENLERVFERFYKVDEFVPGAGLGLSICRTMAFSLGGSVTVESKLGQGSTFMLEIPIQ